LPLYYTDRGPPDPPANVISSITCPHITCWLYC